MFVSLVMVPVSCISWPRFAAKYGSSGAGFSRSNLRPTTMSALLLLLPGFGSVLNCNPTLAAKAEQASSMACMEPLVGAVKSTSLAQATAPRKLAPM